MYIWFHGFSKVVLANIVVTNNMWLLNFKLVQIKY